MVDNGDGSTTTTDTALNGGGSIAQVTAGTVSADGLTKTLPFDWRATGSRGAKFDAGAERTPNK
ncbi:MAG TPA: hypothetical protein VFA53_06660 [Xanthobacteraceae bacterium]|nr:hypothetical protein [Xanthobacteraceae bacterium]